jgi:hypothetical protein
MLPSGDLLKLHVQSEAKKFLKPWWDVVIDYLILVLVMIAVVCGVVGLYASGPVCIPVLRCPAQKNSSALNKITCAMIHNSSRKGEDSLDIAVRFTNRNMFDYVNSECGKDIFCLVRLFPNVLLVIAGYCVVCSNAWFAIKSPILEQMSDLLHDCYKHAYAVNNPTSTRPSTSHTTQKQHATPQVACATAEKRNRVERKSKRFVQDFEGNDRTNCPCGPNSRSIKKSYISEGAGTSQQRTTLLSISEQHVTPVACATAENDSTNCPCCPNFRSMKKSYISEGASTSQQRTTSLNTTPEQHVTPVACATAEDRNREETKLQRFVRYFEDNDSTKGGFPVLARSSSQLAASDA